MPHDPREPSEPPTHSSWVDMRGQGSLGWAVAAGLCVFLTIGATVLTAVTAATQTLGAAVWTLLLALFLGLLSWPLVRMAPRHSTRQGISVDDTGITLVQEPRWWFPGRAAHIPWSRVLRASRDRSVQTGGGVRTIWYYVVVELHAPLDGARYPTWVIPEEGGIRIQIGEWEQARLARALHAARPDLCSDG
ncbi:hypothetical protein [Nocardiopsis halotolerans]|uniref:hypothetical protein n=1 Tax=Nocardiopsis halotolerans TaxID=124252 RepID=UPI00034AB0F6|nr:hypothetical protein [Nocardiopsis halotolerans]